MALVFQDPGIGPGLQALGGSLGQVLQQVGQQRNERKQNEEIGTFLQDALRDAESADDYVAIASKLATMWGGQRALKELAPIFTPLIKGKIESQSRPALSEKMQEKKMNLERGIKTLDRMDQLIADSGLFSGVGATFGKAGPTSRYGKSGEMRGEYRKLGQSLIPLAAAGVSIRNKNEFDEYRKIIANPDATLAQMRGATKGLRQLINDSLEQYSSFEGVPRQQASPAAQEATPPESPQAQQEEGAVAPQGEAEIPIGKIYRNAQGQRIQKTAQGWKPLE